MKKLLWISGAITAFLLAFLLTGAADEDAAINTVLRQGNRQYASALYEGALKSYEAGLAISPENRILNFNAAQSAYMLGEYEIAIEYYEKSIDSIERFLNSGNAALRLGETSDDESAKALFCAQALQAYRDGIIKFPQNVALKYNYEVVKEKIEELSNNQEQNNDNQNQESGNDDQENQENQESQEQDGQSQEREEQSQDQYEQDGTDGEQNQFQEEDLSEQGEDSEENHSSLQEREDGEDEPDLQAIERILRMLEMQEEQSLKNNREVIRGNEDKYGW